MEALKLPGLTAWLTWHQETVMFHLRSSSVSDDQITVSKQNFQRPASTAFIEKIWLK